MILGLLGSLFDISINQIIFPQPNGLAAFQRYMGTFERREGKEAVLEFLSMLRIDFNDTRKSIIDLALCMLLNNRMHGHNLWCSVL